MIGQLQAAWVVSPVVFTTPARAGWLSMGSTRSPVEGVVRDRRHLDDLERHQLRQSPEPCRAMGTSTAGLRVILNVATARQDPPIHRGPAPLPTMRTSNLGGKSHKDSKTRYWGHQRCDLSAKAAAPRGG